MEKGDLGPTNLSKTAIVMEHFFVDGAHDKRIIGIANLGDAIWDDICFFGRITKGERSFLS